MNSNKRLTRQKETEVATVIEDILEKSVRTIEMMREGKDVDNVFAELYHSIQKLKNLQRSDRRVKDSDPTTEKRKLERFVNWIKGFNLENWDNLQIADYGHEGKGIKTVKDIKKGEKVITVPSDLILTPLAKLNEDSSLFKFLTNVLDGADTIQLVVRLLVEKFTLKSFWSPYIDILPQNFQTPLNWTWDEILLIKDTMILYVQVIHQWANVALHYCTTWRSLDPKKYDFLKRSQLTWDNWVWAMNVVLSRQNDIRILDTKQPALNSHQNHSHQDHCSHCQHTHESITNENKSSLSTTDESKEHKPTQHQANEHNNSKASGTEDSVANKQKDVEHKPPYKVTYCLIPVFDLFNHEYAHEFSGSYDMVKNEVELLAGRDFKKDEQVRMFYGPRPNYQLLLNQGFLTNHNPNDMILIAFKTMPSHDKFYKEKCEILQKILPGWKTDETDIQWPLFVDQISLNPKLLAFLRVLFLSSETEVAKAKQLGSELEKQIVSIEHEKKVLKMLFLKLQQHRNRFPTTLAEDRKRLQEDKTLSVNARLALNYVILEKQILEKYLELVVDTEKKLTQQ